MNLYNGSMNVNLPLLAVGGRGEAGFTIQLPVSIKWDVSGSIDPDPLPACPTPCRVFDFLADWWGNIDWAYRPAVILGRTSGESVQRVCTNLSGYGEYHFATVLTRLTVRLADGTEFELRDLASGGSPKNTTGTINCSDLNAGGFERGRTWVSSDGSAATFISNTTIRDTTAAPSATIHPSGVLYLKNGLQYHFQAGKAFLIRDRNGNKVSIQTVSGPDPLVESFDITDPLGRVISVRKGYAWTFSGGTGTYDVISYPGANGASRSIKIYRRDYWLDALCTYNSSCGAKPSTSQLFGEGSSIPEYFKTVSKVELPDQRIYRFYYNDYAEPARLELPTGGAIEYDWGNGVDGATYPLVFSSSGSTLVASYRRVKERREYRNGGGSATSAPWSRKTTYAVTESQGQVAWDDPQPVANPNRCGAASTWCTEVIATDSGTTANGSTATLAVSKHYFYGRPREGFFLLPFQYSNWMEGREFRTIVQQPGGSELSKEIQLWAQRDTPAWWTGWTAPTDPPRGPEPGLDVRRTAKTWNGPDGRLAKSLFEYSADVFNNQTVVEDYDFGATPGTVGPLLRKTKVEFFTSSAYTAVTPGTTAFANSGVHLRGIVLKQTICASAVCDDTQNEALTEWEIDGAPLGSLEARSNATGHDTVAFGTSFTQRGNATKVRVLKKLASDIPVSAQSEWLETKLRFDVLGNQTAIRDPRDNTVQIEYNDWVLTAPGATECTQVTGPQTYAFRTRVINANQWPNQACYDYSLGAPVRFTDMNGVQSRIRYEESGLDRLAEVYRIKPGTPNLSSKTSYSYGDNVGSLYLRTATSQLNDSDQNLKTEIRFDGMGRKTRSSVSENGSFDFSTSGIHTDTVTDGLGRVVRSSNPYRTGGAVQFTTNVLDALGRPTSIEHADGSSVLNTYLGVKTKVRDEACREREIENDALGRVRLVREDTLQCSGDLTAPAQWETSYVFDTQGKLRNVQQGIQTRTFIYDRAGRLKSAENPESGVTRYEYDGNGNLMIVTDARNQSTIRTYDALDRLLTVTSPDGFGQNTVERLCYDGRHATETGCTGSDTVRGLLTGTWSTSSSSAYTADALGRITLASQLPAGSALPYSLEFTYNVDGTPATVRYPSSRLVAYQYDAAGRAKKVGLNVVGAGEYAMDMTYAPHGALATAQWGNGVTESWTFNNRLQAQTMQASKGGLLLGLTFGYGTANNNGNVLTQTIQVGSQKTYLQTYSYDDLNRLTRVDEATQAGGGNSWWMSFDYGRYGNRWVSGASNGVALHAATATAQSQYDESKNQLIKQSNGQNLPGNAHDAAGNLQNHPELGVMIFDGQNRLVRHTASGGVVNMFYDAEGRRVKKTSPNGTVHYIYGPGGKLWAEDGGAGWPGTATRRFLTSDTLGSTRLVTDSTGVVKERRDYHPFGEEIPASTVFGSRNNVTDGGVTTYNEAPLVNQRFTGKERDAETGLDYFEARYMASVQGRFTSPDPLLESGNPKNPQSWNRYAYTFNNPFRFVDPNGLCSAPVVKPGETGVCIDLFIASPTIGGVGLGDNRGTAPNDPNATYRQEILLAIDPAKGSVRTVKDDAGTSTINILGIEYSQKGSTITEVTQLSKADESGNKTFSVATEGLNGLSHLPGAPKETIKTQLDFVVSPEGKIGLDGGMRTAYPSIEVYRYDNRGKPVSIYRMGESGNAGDLCCQNQPIPKVRPR